MPGILPDQQLGLGSHTWLRHSVGKEGQDMVRNQTEAAGNLARALQFQCWLLVFSGWGTGAEVVYGRAAMLKHISGWILPLSHSCQLELLAPKSCAREAVDPVPVLGSEACAQAKGNKVEDEPLQGQG